jgi:hypothetical protein
MPTLKSERESSDLVHKAGWRRGGESAAALSDRWLLCLKRMRSQTISITHHLARIRHSQSTARGSHHHCCRCVCVGKCGG